ncbi:hypothetical protein J2W35_004252 [Variovorax boronicumulans]|uniref:DUF4102 domain-containing protein n=1 Tax=Variovorax boronicumulans TaxID=436515 RepID=UPI00277E7058|nr:DUF4102 domain-containing protein [Variovorax boronicumulans]MDQ0083886.1 hypothetical protein [Variovorax boronicumulans]
MPLTDVACKNARCAPEKLRSRFADSGGLYLEVTPAGAKHWRWKYRFDGKEKRLAIGSYPAIPLGEARAARERARLVLKGGADPVGAKREAKAAAKVRRDNTFKAVALDWFEHWKGTKSERHAENVRRRLESDVYQAAISATPRMPCMARSDCEACRARRANTGLGRRIPSPLAFDWARRAE